MADTAKMAELVRALATRPEISMHEAERVLGVVTDMVGKGEIAGSLITEIIPGGGIGPVSGDNACGGGSNACSAADAGGFLAAAQPSAGG